MLSSVDFLFWKYFLNPLFIHSEINNVEPHLHKGIMMQAGLQLKIKQTKRLKSCYTETVFGDTNSKNNFADMFAFTHQSLLWQGST